MASEEEITRIAEKLAISKDQVSLVSDLLVSGKLDGPSGLLEWGHWTALELNWYYDIRKGWLKGPRPDPSKPKPKPKRHKRAIKLSNAEMKALSERLTAVSYECGCPIRWPFADYLAEEVQEFLNSLA